MVCGGNKKLIYYLNCKINWHNYKDVYITEPNCIPFNKLKQAPAELIYDVDDTKVSLYVCGTHCVFVVDEFGFKYTY